MGSGSDNVTVFKGGIELLGGNQTRNVGHVHHQQGTIGIGNFTVTLVIEITRVSGSTSNDHGRLEKTGIALELVVVDQTSLGVDTVRETFKVNRSGRNSLANSFLLGVGVETVSQVSTRGKIESHDTVMGSEKTSVHGKVGRGTRVRLDINTPLIRIQAVRLEGTLLAKFFNLVDNLVTTIVTSVGETLSVLVGQSRTQAVHDGLAGKVLRRDKLQGAPLTALFLLNQIEQFGVMLFQRDETTKFLPKWLVWAR